MFEPSSVSHSVLAEESSMVAGNASGKSASASAEPVTRYAASPCLKSVWASHSGLVRAHNEDRGLLAPTQHLFALADGMGGYNAGEVASQMAVEMLQTHCEAQLSVDDPDLNCSQWREQTLQTALVRANHAIVEAAHKRPECLGMGTTGVAVMFSESVPTDSDLEFSVGHVGDSRCYVVGKANIRLLTKDHSVGQELVDRGLMSLHDLKQHSMRGVLTRALGVESDMRVDVISDCLRPQEILLLCSDGLTDLLDDSDIIDIVGPISRLRPTQAMLEQTATELIRQAIGRGGFDNVSALLVARP